MATGSFSVWDGKFGKSRCAEVVTFKECNDLAALVRKAMFDEPQWQTIAIQVDAEGNEPAVKFNYERVTVEVTTDLMWSN